MVATQGYFDPHEQRKAWVLDPLKGTVWLGHAETYVMVAAGRHFARVQGESTYRCIL